MKLTIVLYPGEDGFVVAECPAIPGCVSQGKTEGEAIANIKEAIEGCIEVRKKYGWPLFEKTLEIEVAV
ncbi:MAG: type II toxin-antitoxin system HicB family antitoxin [Armatimonadetes bacterium]|nr:type II toxin-antitoxin system HicB family antitoxin [Armatimonadota bacterium]